LASAQATNDIVPGAAIATTEPSGSQISAPPSPPVVNTSPADEPAETGALAPSSAAVTSTANWDQEPNLIVEDKPPAAADRVATAPATALEADAKSDAANTEEAPTTPTPPPAPDPSVAAPPARRGAKPAAAAAPLRHVSPAKPAAREREPAPVRTVTAPRPRVVAPRPQYAPQSYDQGYYEPQARAPAQQVTRPRSAAPQYAPQQYAPQQLAPRPRPQPQPPSDQFLSPYGTRSQYGG
jgi:hypothetical protein